VNVNEVQAAKIMLYPSISSGLLFSAPGLGKYISGAILYEETLFQSSSEGTPFVDLLKKNGLFPGIKVDTGLQPLPGADPIETWCVASAILSTLLDYMIYRIPHITAAI
jgi:fructose-bisphosphate aldolase class 1